MLGEQHKIDMMRKEIQDGKMAGFLNRKMNEETQNL